MEAVAPESGTDNGTWVTVDATTTAERSGTVGYAQQTGTIQIDRTLFRTPGDRGNVTIARTVTLPDGVTKIEMNLGQSRYGSSYHIVSTTGFSYDQSAETLTLQSSDGETTTGSFRLRRHTVEGNAVSPGAVETSEWAFTSVVGVPFGYRYVGDAPIFRRQASVDGAGYATNGFAFMGNVSVQSRSGTGQQFTLVVPTSATSDLTPAQMLTTLQSASSQSLGPRNGDVTAFVVSDPVRRGGASIGRSLWIHETSPRSTLAHEYVHTRQVWTQFGSGLDMGSSFEWVTEASADYYGELLPWQNGHVTDSQFGFRVSTDQYADAVLQDADSVSTESKNYEKGRRVLAALDIRIRQHTGGDATLTDVLQTLNTMSGTLAYSDFRSAVVAKTNSSTGDWLDTYVTTSSAPTIPSDIAAAYDTSNTPPTAVADGYTTAEGTTLSVSAPGVLANDSDADGDTLSVSVVSRPANGSLALDADGSFQYTPQAGFSGQDSLSYRVADGNGGTDTATATVTVTQTNTAPEAATDRYTLNQNTTLSASAPGVLVNDTDADGDSLSAAVASGPTNGTLALSANGSLKYVPDTGFSGTDQFAYRVADGNGGNDTATVTFVVEQVNGPPVAAVDRYRTAENTTLTVPAPGVLGNDSDPDGDTLSAAVASSPTNGTVTLATNGSLQYTPDAGFAGEDQFAYRVADGNGGTDTATVTVVVEQVNGPPEATADSYAVAQNATLAVSAPGVVANDTDPDGDTLSVTTVAGPSNGTLTLASNGSVRYTPRAGFSGRDDFTYRVADGNGGTDTATVTVTVEEVNTAPEATADRYRTVESTALIVPAPGVVADDTDADGDTLSVTVANAPTNGTLTLASNGSVRYTPDSGFTGEDQFVYRVADGNGGTDTATVTVGIAAVNTSPNATDDRYSTDRDTALTVSAPGVLANDRDSDRDTLTATVESGPSNGAVTLAANGSLRYTPTPGFTGDDRFSYAVADGNGGTDTANVTVAVTGNTVTLPGQSEAAADLDGDARLEDVDGDGQGTLFDALTYYNARESPAVTGNPTAFDFDGDGQAGTLFDALALYNDVS